MNPVILIPTYVSGRRRTDSSHTMSTNSIMHVYDHTTSLAREGELGRCLESLQKVRGARNIVILVVADPIIEEEAAEKIHGIASRFQDLNTIIIGAPEQQLIRQRMEQLQLGRNEDTIGLAGYSAVRNMGLVVANVLGFDSVVFLDDDVVVDDEDFMVKAVYGLGKHTKKGVPIVAKSGYYFNFEGSYLSMSQDHWYNRFWNQGKAFNRWIEAAMKGPRLSRSNHVCGGCLALHYDAYTRVAFDPNIPRGEDLDYLLNLRMYGSDIWFDNKWNMRHLPPNTKNEGTRFRQDIYRWLYEYRKMEFSRTQIDLMQIKPQSLEPYPGPFLEPSISWRIRVTAWLRSFGRPDKKAYREAARAAANEAATYAQTHCSDYFQFQFVWPEIMARMANDQILRTALVQTAALREAGVTPVMEEPVQEAEPEGGAQVADRQAVLRDLPAIGQQPEQQNFLDPGATTEIRLNLAE